MFSTYVKILLIAFKDYVAKLTYSFLMKIVNLATFFLFNYYIN